MKSQVSRHRSSALTPPALIHKRSPPVTEVESRKGRERLAMPVHDDCVALPNQPPALRSPPITEIAILGC
jgi:hypothetical protein